MVLDPSNEFKHKRPKGVSETDYISEALSKIRSFARQHDIHVFIVAHPTKLQKLIEQGGKYPIPTAYDIAGSANWFNKSDNIISVYRTYEHDITRIYIQKIRFEGINGKRGEIECSFDPKTGTITRTKP